MKDCRRLSSFLSTCFCPSSLELHASVLAGVTWDVAVA